MLVEVAVSALGIEPKTRAPFVVLKEREGVRSLPIWIGVFEASAIAAEMEKIHPVRPMTHDLLKNVLQGVGGSLIRVEIVDLKENTFFATLRVGRSDQTESEIDARPSDAIALALRCSVPILVEESVFEKGAASPRSTGPSQATLKDKDKWEDVLKNLSPEVFGKYKQ